MDRPAFTQLISALSGDRTPRVWSLLVTVFGELAQEREARISGSVLSQLTELIGIKPEAMRVALHRLRKDGWIDSQRQGRNSAYFLTDWGRAQSAAASPRIYASEPESDDAWLVLTDPGQPAAADATGGAWISSNMLIAPRPPELAGLFATRIDAGAALPGWMTGKICSAETAELSRDLAQRLQVVQRSTAQSSGLSPLQCAALRVLIVHSWRRIVLKIPALPDRYFPAPWAGAQCRQSVTALLAQLPKPALADLEAVIAG
ncbi:PaaX family transcriptional regulator C-terminal domain-containing protein [Sulfitobacter aestuarii]|uniref:PaaX family transcriptional regulator C-terminal domain-containing protein n=1 Tax=Sulfitobacter aestuarii TaxID=2161676 RepID=A0ABW5U382_9RHOB